MKKLSVFIVIIFTLHASSAFAQRTIGHVDLQYIINAMPEGVKLRAESDALTRVKSQEFDRMREQVEEAKEEYDRNKEHWSEQERANKEAQ